MEHNSKILREKISWKTQSLLINCETKPVGKNENNTYEGDDDDFHHHHHLNIYVTLNGGQALF